MLLETRLYILISKANICCNKLQNVSKLKKTLLNIQMCSSPEQDGGEDHIFLPKFETLETIRCEKIIVKEAREEKYYWSPSKQCGSN